MQLTRDGNTWKLEISEADAARVVPDALGRLVDQQPTVTGQLKQLAKAAFIIERAQGSLYNDADFDDFDRLLR